jgi:transposase
MSPRHRKGIAAAVNRPNPMIPGNRSPRKTCSIAAANQASARRDPAWLAEHRGDYESEYAAIRSIAAKLGIATPETLRQWVRQAEVDSGQRAGVSSEESAEIRRLRAEVKELRRANEILKAASAFFAAELDRPLTRS